ncbi:MAG: Flp pilus assembly complex ATPase component TadA [Armatimonadetes bacterium]|nr:Flp pilus assembly complex ATPase component TadA [Armatimonadota bacterium]
MSSLLDPWLARAVERAGTDLHLDPLAEGAVVRLRIDGALGEIARLSADETAAAGAELAQRLGLAEGALLGAGRFRVDLGGRSLEVRGSLAPTLHGPRYCLRLVDREQALVPWDTLFHRPANSAAARRLLRRPHGLIVVAGPAGSGKTTVAARLLDELAGVRLNAMSVEDPIEFDLDWVAQASVDRDRGLTHQSLLRAALGQDPDVLMISDLPDEETARLAVEATTSGHLVIVCVPANDGLSALAWLREMGVPAWSLGAAFVGAVGVRLVRRVCHDCAVQVPPKSASAMMALGLDGELDLVTMGDGCDSCDGTGYHGRVPLVELIEATQALSDAVGRDAPRDVLEELAFSPNLPPFRQQAAELVTRALTTPEEAYRALYSVLG